MAQGNGVLGFKFKPRYPKRLGKRHLLAIYLVRYGYANRVPGSWMIAATLVGPDRFPPGTFWNEFGERGRSRMLKNGHDPRSY
jgi:hypothetical protein